MRRAVPVLLAFLIGAAGARAHAEAVEVRWEKLLSGGGGGVAVSADWLNLDARRMTLLRLPVTPRKSYQGMVMLWKQIGEDRFSPANQIRWVCGPAGRPQTIVRSLAAYPQWRGIIGQLALVMEQGRFEKMPSPISVEPATAGTLFQAFGQELWQLEPIQGGTVNYMKGPMIHGISLTEGGLVALGVLGFFFLILFRFRLPKAFPGWLRAALILFFLLDARWAFDQLRLARNDLYELGPLSPEERMGALGDPDFLRFIQRARAEVPGGRTISLTVPSEYHRVWGTYYVAPHPVVADGEYRITYDSDPVTSGGTIIHQWGARRFLSRKDMPAP